MNQTIFFNIKKITYIQIAIQYYNNMNKNLIMLFTCQALIVNLFKKTNNITLIMEIV